MNLTRQYYFLILIILFSKNTFSQTTISSGNVSGLWSQINSPYNIIGDITIPADSLLTIEPGVQVKFQGAYKFTINGRLLAVGLVADTIVFTSSFDSIPLHWNGLRFSNNLSSDTSKIVFCKLEKGYAQSQSWDLSRGYGSAIDINNYASLIISNNLITNNFADFNGAINCLSSNPVIKNNNITYNYSNEGGGIFSRQSNPIITGNKITNNTAGLGGGGAIFIDILCNAIISDNIITNNYAYVGGAGIVCISNAFITGNIITNNDGNGGSGAIDCSASSPTLINNIICNNTSSYGGGAISCFYGSSPTLINNTIANNNSDLAGGSVFCRDSSSPTFINCILYGNITQTAFNQVHLYDNTCHPNFINCDIETGISAIGSTSNINYTGTFQSNIDLPPMFTSPTFSAGLNYNAFLANWSLQQISPCVNAGKADTTGLNLPPIDYAGNHRVIGRIDIGAFEDQLNTSSNEKLFNNFVLIFPNPCEGKTNLVFANLNNENFDLEITSINGQTIFVKKINNNSQLVVQIDLSDYMNGIYFVKIKNDHISKIEKLVILR